MVRHVRRRDFVRSLPLFSFALSVLALSAFGWGCAAPSDSGDDANDAEHQDEEGTSEDAISSLAIADYEVIAPEARITTAAIAAKLGPRVEAGRTVFAIRTLSLQNERVRLVVDGSTLVTSLVPEGALATSARAATATDRASDSPYAKSLASLAASGSSLDRLASSSPNLGAEEPFALTIDMCQSRKPWDRKLFEWAVTLSDQLRKPVPLGIAMTGLWAKAHPAELDELLGWERSGKITITWINHSSTHPLHCQNASCSKAQFLTAPSVDFDEEVLGEERTVIARGMIPSVIFRFPGLIHDATRLRQLNRLSMLPIDANGWIAKGQPIAPRAVVLVHGNGNEPEGITGFLRQVGTPARSAALRSGKSALVPPTFIAPTPPTSSAR